MYLFRKVSGSASSTAARIFGRCFETGLTTSILADHLPSFCGSGKSNIFLRIIILLLNAAKWLKYFTIYTLSFMIKGGEKRPLGTPRRRLEDKTKMVLQEVGWGGPDWIDRAQDNDRLVNEVLNIRVPQNVGNLLTSWGPLSFPRRNVIHGNIWLVSLLVCYSVVLVDWLDGRMIWCVVVRWLVS